MKMEPPLSDLNSSVNGIRVSFESLLCRSNIYDPLIDGAEKYNVIKPCNGSGVNVIDCQHEQRQAFVDDVGSLDMNTKQLVQLTPEFPANVQVIPRDIFALPASTVADTIVGINIKDILSTHARLDSCGNYHIPRGLDINSDALNEPIFQGKQVVLFSSAIDSLIEHLWYRRDALKLFDKIASMDFYAVTGMNFSVFLGECPFAHALNINKTLAYCEALDRRGVSTIPNVYAVNEPQRQRWTAYLNTRPNVQCVVMNSQLQRNKQSVDVDNATLYYLLEHTAVSIMLQGRRARLPADLARGGRIHLASSGSLKRDAIINATQVVSAHLVI